jgi:UMF1 family MFS transporter
MPSADMPGNRRAVASWCLYDWANSAFNTLVITFIYNTYFTQAFAPNPAAGTVLWSRGIALSAVLIALLSPVLGAIADRGGRRRRYLAIATFTCVAFTAALTFVSPGQSHAALMALTLFVLANVAFEMGVVFYNSFLPGLVSQEKIGRISGYGWGIGYIGGLAAMILALVGFVRPDSPWFEISTANGFNIRATNLLVAVWFLVFSLPMLLFVPEDTVRSERVDVRGAFADLARTFRALGRYREVVKFLIARLVYNDGLVTIFAFGAIYAAGTFGMEMDEVILFGIALNVMAGLGALAFGFVDDRIGGKKTILITLTALIAATILAVLAPTKAWVWVAGILIGIFVGPNQSASRSLMGRFVPEQHKGEFFGFFAFSGKVTSFMGPVLLGLVTGYYGQRLGVATLVLFFIVGGALLTTVDEQRGIEAAGGPDIIGGRAGT